MILSEYQKKLAREISEENIINVLDFISKYLSLSRSPFRGPKIVFDEDNFASCISKLNAFEGRKKITDFFSLCLYLEKNGFIIFITDEQRKKDKRNGLQIHFQKDIKKLMETSHFLSVDNYATQLFEYDFLVLPELKEFIFNKFKTKDEIQNHHTRVIGYTGIFATIIFIIVSYIFGQFNYNFNTKQSEIMNKSLIKADSSQIYAGRNTIASLGSFIKILPIITQFSKNTLNFKIKFINYGSAPAVSFFAKVSANISTPNMANINTPIIDTVSIGVLDGSDSVFITPRNKIVLQKGIYENILAGILTLKIIGFVEYKNFVGNKFKRTYSYYYIPVTNTFYESDKDNSYDIQY